MPKKKKKYTIYLFFGFKLLKGEAVEINIKNVFHCKFPNSIEFNDLKKNIFFDLDKCIKNEFNKINCTINIYTKSIECWTNIKDKILESVKEFKNTNCPV
jgi:hypothetical protein